MKVVELTGTERKPEWFDPASEDRQLDPRYEDLLEEEQGDQYEAARRLIEEVSPRKETRTILDTKIKSRLK